VKKTIVLMSVLCLVGATAWSEDLSYPCDNEAAYMTVLNQLKKDGFDIDSAGKDAGIQTAATTVGGFKQTASYVKVTFLPNDKKLRVLVYESTRVRVGTLINPWGAARVNPDKSAAEVLRLKNELGW
jgi:hypothetical protein